MDHKEAIFKEMTDLGYTVAEAHQHWCHTMRESGWVYGKQLNMWQKEDPTLIDFRHLTVEQKFDYIEMVDRIKRGAA